MVPADGGVAEVVLGAETGDAAGPTGAGIEDSRKLLVFPNVEPGVAVAALVCGVVCDAAVGVDYWVCVVF